MAQPVAGILLPYTAMPISSPRFRGALPLVRTALAHGLNVVAIVGLFALFETWRLARDVGPARQFLPWTTLRQLAVLYGVTTIPIVIACAVTRSLTHRRMRLDDLAFTLGFALCGFAFVFLGTLANMWLPQDSFSPTGLGVSVLLAAALSAIFVPLARALGALGPPLRSALIATPSVLLLAAIATSAPAIDGERQGWRTSGDAGVLPATRPPNVVIILIDTMRADRVSSYGHRRRTSPALDAVGGEGARFANAYAQSASTRPSVSTLFSSLYPSQHGNNTIENTLDPSVTTLAEHFRSSGYTTYAYSTNRHITPRFGFAQGFDLFHFAEGDRLIDESVIGRAYSRALPRLMAWLDSAGLVSHEPGLDLDSLALRRLSERVAAGLREPYFLYLHLLAPHDPYTARQPFRGVFGVERRHHQPPETGDVASLPATSLEATALEDMLAAYDAEIAWADARAAEALDLLETAAGTNRTITVVTSDHGEEFYDHDNWRHGHTLYNELTHVLLVVRFADVIEAGMVIDEPVGLIDLYPTLVGLAGLSAPELAYGRDLSALLTGRMLSEPTPAYSELMKDRTYGVLRSVVTASGMKYIETERDGQRFEQLFSLADDPDELNNMAESGERGTSLEPYRELLRQFSSYVADTRVVPQAAIIDGDTRERLRALGYVQ